MSYYSLLASKYLDFVFILALSYTLSESDFDVSESGLWPINKYVGT